MTRALLIGKEPGMELGYRYVSEPPYDAVMIGLRTEPRQILYDRIDRRVDAMMEEGLLEETRTLAARGVFDVSPTAAAAIGYKELLPHLSGKRSLDEAIADLKLATRRYAKRQMTWFRARPYVRWITADDGKTARKYEEIVNMALELCEAPDNML